MHYLHDFMSIIKFPKKKIYSYVVALMKVIRVTNYIFYIRVMLDINVHVACLNNQHSKNKTSFNNSSFLNFLGICFGFSPEFLLFRQKSVIRNAIIFHKITTQTCSGKIRRNNWYKWREKVIYVNTSVALWLIFAFSDKKW